MRAAEPSANGALRLAASCLTATIAFWAYTSTLLPGVDLGDTGGFQAAVMWPEASARRAYPLYYAVGMPFVAAVSPGNPARGLNLFSALWAAGAVGLLVWLASALSGSVLAGAAAGLLLAFSYTFWTQAVIAEVYSLHLALVGASLIALHAYASRPTTGRLAGFFAIYALSFGNHLSMILLLVPCAIFLVQTNPRPRELFRPHVIGIAVGIGIAGALQYAGGFLSVWWSLEASSAWTDRVAAFWFDTTKSDWRESMVLGVDPAQMWDRLAMWGWDARQQFGLAGLAVAAIGAVRLWWLSRPWALAVTLSFLLFTGFALTYNVGDTHVFFLPGHLLTALAASVSLARRGPVSDPGSGPGQTRVSDTANRHAVVHLRTIAACGLLLYAGWRGWSTWPAVDRHLDRRADGLVARLVRGLDDQTSVLLSQMDWQTENGVLYATRYHRRDVAWTRLADVMPHLPFFVRDNHTIGREIVLTEDAAAAVIAAYGPHFPIVEDDGLALPSLTSVVERLPRGTPYILTLLTPPGDERFEPAAFDDLLKSLSVPEAPSRTNRGYEIWIGLTGESRPTYMTSSRPFRADFAVLGDRFTVRMDAWLPIDTFRRGGFGHVLRGREHVLTVERGASLVWFQADARPITAYMGSLYAPERRFRIPTGANLTLAALRK